MQLSSRRYQAICARISAFMACAFAASAIAYSQTSAGDPQKKDTAVYQSPAILRATTRLVIVDAVVLDEKGRPIPDLKADDFTVLEDGKPQKIRDFSFHQPGSGGAPAPRPASNIISNAPQFSSNSCLNVILLDAINTDFSSHAYAQDMLVKYLETNPTRSMTVFPPSLQWKVR